MPLLLKRGPSLVKGKSFSKERVIGPALPSVRVYQARNVDELIILDVSTPSEDFEGVERFSWIKEVNRFLTMPLSVGGGIRMASQVQYLIQNGADRVVFNSALRNDQSLVEVAVATYGSQSVVASIDVALFEGSWRVYDSWLQRPLNLLLESFIVDVQNLGVGEILLTSYRCEGHMRGFDLDLLDSIVDLIDVPLSFCGGAGCLADFCSLMKSADSIGVEISAMAASSCFHFTHITPAEVSMCLREAGFDTRVS